jgi:hypothetical protein
MQIKLNLQSGLMQMNFANWISNCILLPFNNYLEEWEHVARVTKNSAQEKLIKDKYMYIYLYDDDASDLRRVVDIEWKPRQRGVSGSEAQYVVVTQLITTLSDQDDASMEPYFINSTLHEMIQLCHAQDNVYNKQYRMVVALE